MAYHPRNKPLEPLILPGFPVSCSCCILFLWIILLISNLAFKKGKFLVIYLLIMQESKMQAMTSGHLTVREWLATPVIFHKHFCSPMNWFGHLIFSRFKTLGVWRVVSFWVAEFGCMNFPIIFQHLYDDFNLPIWIQCFFPSWQHLSLFSFTFCKFLVWTWDLQLMTCCPCISELWNLWESGTVRCILYQLLCCSRCEADRFLVWSFQTWVTKTGFVTHCSVDCWNSQVYKFTLYQSLSMLTYEYLQLSALFLICFSNPLYPSWNASQTL